MKRIAIINTVSNYGSTGRIAEAIGEAARQAGHEVLLAHGTRYSRSSSLADITVTSRRDEYVHYVLHSLLLGQSGHGSRDATKEFLRNLDAWGPDLIHIHNLHGYYINYPLLLEYIICKKLPVIWTLHDCWPLTGHCTHFEGSGCMKWMSGCHACALRAAYPRSLWRDTSRSAFELKRKLITMIPDLTFVAPSQWMAGIAGRSPMAVHADVKVIYNGVDTDIFTPQPPSGNRGKIQILGVANGFTAAKGVGDFLRLSEYLGPSYEVRLTGVDTAVRRRLPREIITEPRTDSMEHLAQIYSDADIFVNPTYADTLGCTSIEALACGTPVVAYNTGGVAEVVTPDTGIIVKRGDVGALAEAIRHLSLRLASDSRDIIPAVCRQRALQEFTMQSMTASYLRLYK